jgi:hypothetical protein
MTTAETNARSGAAKSPQNTVEDRPGSGVPSWVPRLLVISTLFVVLLTACWVGAFRTPSPHGVPVGVVAGAHLPQSSAVSVTSYADAADLEQAVQHGTIVGGLAVESGQAVIYLGEAQGRYGTTFATTFLTGAAAHAGLKPQVRPLAPYGSGDTAGLVPFFIALSLLVPCLIAGGVIGSTRSLRGPKGVALLVGFSVLAYVIDWLVADVWLGAITGSGAAYAAVVLLDALAVTAIAAGLASWALPFIAVLGALFFGLGVPATGGPASMDYFIPSFFHDLQLYLPPSAAVYGIRGAEWFASSGVPIVCVALGAWALAGILALLVRGRLEGTSATPKESTA